jgi:hypothetical protein
MPDPAFRCPHQDSDPQYSYDELVQRITREGSDGTFGRAFTQTLIAALRGDRLARICIEAWYQPEEAELLELGIHQSRVGSTSRCTDSGHLLVDRLKGLYSDLFM